MPRFQRFCDLRTLHFKVLDNSKADSYHSRMGSIHTLKPRLVKEPPALHNRAMDNLRFIRETMERASSFTAVPGWGGVFMGVSAVGAAAIASQQASAKAWFLTWLVEALVAFVIGGWAMDRKARRAEVPLLSGPGRKFALGLAPPMFAGVILTLVLVPTFGIGIMPGIWLLLYGTGIVTGGMFSVRIVPIMGLCFMLMGTVSLFSPHRWSNLIMALGFGFLHIIFGVIIARKHGG